MEALLNLHERCVVLKDLPDCDCAQILRYFEDLRGYCEACVDKTISGETIWVILFSTPEGKRVFWFVFVLFSLFLFGVFARLFLFVFLLFVILVCLFYF